MHEQFFRTQMLLGEPAMERLQKARVAVFGLGGVGGYVVEALARSGVGQLDLIDNDTVGFTNLNRQILATYATLGMPKTEAARERVLQINPACCVRTHALFFGPDTESQFDFAQYDYIVDAIDTVTGKLALVQKAHSAGTPIISCMGTGNKLDAAAFQVADISKTSMCPLARVMRKELKKRGIAHLKVVYSQEEAQTPTGWEEEAAAIGKRQIPGSLSYVPGAAGLILAGEVIKDIAGI
ncbi:MAG TPA: tRNA threonylcarbamoyladenosine dehydratase [Candidatus Faecousia faecavium]|nr:tRNA threonylcarbamoyladenosine dehydratase [Candidatus Faecousia faecavium]